MQMVDDVVRPVDAEAASSLHYEATNLARRPRSNYSNSMRARIGVEQKCHTETTYGINRPLSRLVNILCAAPVRAATRVANDSPRSITRKPTERANGK